jgi:uncharacterized protein
MKKPTSSSFEDTFALDSKMFNDQFALHQTKDGYLVCQPRVARTGIQLYRGAEVGRPDLEEVRVYRPETEVMSRDSIFSLAGKPVTIEHPNEPVTAENWKDNAVGYVGDEILRDGQFVRVPLHLMDAKAVKEVKAGRSQLSVGYTAELLWGDGVTPSGEAYHVKQTAIRANHVAITHTARGGPQLRMGDNDRRKTMALKKIIVDSIEIEVEERDAQIIERHLKALEAALATAKTAQATMQTDSTAAATALATATTESANKDAEIVTLKKQLDDAKVTPKKLQEMARARAHVEVRAKALMDTCVCDDKTDEEIRRQVVNAKLGEAAKGWTDDMITASFNTLTVTTDSNGFVPNSLQHASTIIASGVDQGGDTVSKAYNQYNEDIQNRWKTAGMRNKA